MANTPYVSLLYSNGNLLQDVAAVDGVGALVGTGTTLGLLGVPTSVFNLADAEQQGYTQTAESDMYRHLKEFYGELGGNQELFIMTVPNTMTLTQMVDNTNASGAKVLVNYAQGRIRLLSVFRHPASGYSGGANFIDSDVPTAITNAKIFAQACLGQLQPLRILIEGRVQNPAAANTLTPTTNSNGFTGVVLGGSLNDGSASVGLALGRAVKYGAEVKLGKVANGPLNIASVYIGTSLLKDVTALYNLHEQGFITFLTYAQKAGFYFGIDRMCSTDDYRLLAYGRVIDKAAVVAAAVYTEQLEDTVDLDTSGNLASHEITQLTTQIVQQINVAMGNQISGLQVYIDPSQNIINTGVLTIKLRIMPLGYKSYIEVNLGLNAPTN